jgi:hypothetical protein
MCNAALVAMPWTGPYNTRCPALRRGGGARYHYKNLFRYKYVRTAPHMHSLGQLGRGADATPARPRSAPVRPRGARPCDLVLRASVHSR